MREHRIVCAMLCVYIVTIVSICAWAVADTPKVHKPRIHRIVLP
jgi:hypothetical protein